MTNRYIRSIEISAHVATMKMLEVKSDYRNDNKTSGGSHVMRIRTPQTRIDHLD